MKLWKLSRIDHVGSDELGSVVIRAGYESDAREIANRYAGDEGRIWEDNDLVECERITEEGEEGVIIRDFNAE